VKFNDPNYRPGLSTPERIVFEVDVGDIPPEDVLKYLETVRDKFPKVHPKKKETK